MLDVVVIYHLSNASSQKPDKNPLILEFIKILWEINLIQKFRIFVSLLFVEFCKDLELPSLADQFGGLEFCMYNLF